MIISYEKFKRIFEKTDINFNLHKPVDILIPVYNAFNHLKNLLDSIIANTSIEYRLLICDDCSDDEKIYPYLLMFKKQNKDKNIQIFRNNKNLGFVKTINNLMEKTENHFVIINSDVIVPKNWLKRLIYPILFMENIATTTPFSNSGVFCSFPDFIADNKIPFDLSVNEIDKFFKIVNLQNTYIEIPSGVGFCMAINRNLIEKIGKFDEIFGKGYGEETDWCARAKRYGYKNIIVTNLFVYHKHGASFKNRERIELQNKNLEIIIKRFPEYANIVQKFIKEDKLKILRELLFMLIASNYEKKSILVVDLSNSVFKDYKINLKEYNFYGVLTYSQLENKYLISMNYFEKNVIITSEELENLNKVLNFYNFYEVYYVSESDKKLIKNLKNP